jgi:mannosylglycoprotein endo-beta-mannosidase
VSNGVFDDILAKPPHCGDSCTVQDVLYFSDNMARVPDLFDDTDNIYALSASLQLPDLGPGHYTLSLAGLGHSVRITYNGTQVHESTGYFHRRTLSIPDRTLPVFLDIKPPPKSIPSSQCPDPPVPGINCGQGGDHALASIGGIQYTAGWDWTVAVPDRITGIIDGIYVTRSCGLVIDDVLVDTLRVTHDGTAVVNVTFTATNYRTEPVEANIKLDIKSGIKSGIKSPVHDTATTYATTVTVPPSSFEVVNAVVKIPNAKLWWPHTLGDPHLYTATIAAEVRDESFDASNSSNTLEREHVFGVRVIETYIHPATKGRGFTINDMPLFITGGNWVSTDLMLLNGLSEARYRAEISMHKAAGLNLIRVWGGGITERSLFYEVCDQLGMLVIQEFWMSGDNNGRWGGSYDYPTDQVAYVDQVRDVVLQRRGHASLLMWIGGNELWGDSTAGEYSPPLYIQQGMVEVMAELDPNRFFIMSTMDGGLDGLDMSLHDDSFALAVKDGPYGFLRPFQYYSENNPGMTNGSSVTISFQPEVGASCMPRMTGLARMLGVASDSTEFASENGESVPPLWDLHKFEGYSSTYSNTTVDLVYAYGTPSTVEDYADYANLAALQQYQSLFEGFSLKMFRPAETGGKTAVIMWKTQTPYPSMRGFLYDYWLERTGAFEGVRKGTGGSRRIKPSFDLSTRSVGVVNRGKHDYAGGSVSVSFWNSAGSMLEKQTSRKFGNIEAMSVATSSPVTLPRTDGVVFVRLEMDGASDWSWLRVDDSGEYSYDHSELGRWRSDGPWPEIVAEVSREGGSEEDGGWSCDFTLTVGGSSLVLAPYLQVWGADRRQITNVQYEMDSVLVPGEMVRVRVAVEGQQEVDVGKIVLKHWAGEDLEIFLGR